MEVYRRNPETGALELVQVPSKEFLDSVAAAATNEVQRQLVATGWIFDDSDEMWGKLFTSIENTLEELYPGTDFSNYN